MSSPYKASYGASPSFSNFTMLPRGQRSLSVEELRVGLGGGGGGSGSGLAVRAHASCVIPAPLRDVWAALRRFTWPAELLSFVAVCEMLDGAAPTEVGGVREMRWKTGERQRSRLLALSDLEHSVSWELEWSLAPAEAAAIVSEIKCLPVTEDDFTFVSWTTEFSADASAELINQTTSGNQETLADIERHFFERQRAAAGTSPPIAVPGR